MKISGECANLDLDTTSLSGLVNLDLSSFSVDVDLRQVLGIMYDKYDKFMIIFNGAGGWTNASSYSSTSGTTNLTATTVWSLGMSGLNWAFNSYNGTLSNVAFFPSKLTLPIAGYGNTNFPNFRNGIVFRKPTGNSKVTLKIVPYLTRGSGTAIAVVASGTVQFDFNYSFSIYGLSEE